MLVGNSIACFHSWRKSYGISWNSFIEDGIPLNLVPVPVSAKSHGTCKEFHGTFLLDREIPWNSMEFGVGAKFRETFKIPWNSVEIGNYVWECHGIPYYKGPVKFLEILRNCEILISVYFVIRERYFAVCCIISQGYVSTNLFAIYVIYIYIYMDISVLKQVLLPLISLEWWYSIQNDGLLRMVSVYVIYSSCPNFKRCSQWMDQLLHPIWNQKLM